MLKIGSKLQCEKCKSEFIITKAGEASLKCCGGPVQPK